MATDLQLTLQSKVDIVRIFYNTITSFLIKCLDKSNQLLTKNNEEKIYLSLYVHTTQNKDPLLIFRLTISIFYLTEIHFFFFFLKSTQNKKIVA